MNNKLQAPIGTIIGYGGPAEQDETREALAKQGWLLCDGKALSIKDYEALHRAIGTNFGQPDSASFNLPDLRGLFLRGVSGTSGNDPDAGDRIALQSGGNTGNRVGSYQEYATGKPQDPFQAEIPNNDIGQMKLDTGAGVDPAGRYRHESGSGATNGEGGDLETRPVNTYTYFLIKWTNETAGHEPVSTPVGGILPFGGPASADLLQYWAYCNGSEEQGEGLFKRLYETIGTAYGTSGDQLFNLPDLRGQYLRGVNMDANDRDPEADDRYPQAAGGNEGNRVGSRQDDATAYPVSGDFITKIPHLPESAGDKAITGGGPAAKDTYKWNSGTSGPFEVTESGGDDETRPLTVVIDWYIQFETLPTTIDPFPVGSIIAYGGDSLPESPHWLLCDGAELRKQDYEALYSVIGDLYKPSEPSGPEGNDPSFWLPDLRGKFLRGSNESDDAKVPCRLGETQDYATKLPAKPFETTFNHLPVATKKSHGVTHGDNTADKGSKKQGTCTDGGDKESRPKNVSVNFYIKATI